MQEAYTLQVLPPEVRHSAIERIASFVAPGGVLLVIARGRDNGEDAGSLPWPITQAELSLLLDCGLEGISFEDYFEAEVPPIRRFRATYRSSSG